MPWSSNAVIAVNYFGHHACTNIHAHACSEFCVWMCVLGFLLRKVMSLMVLLLFEFWAGVLTQTATHDDLPLPWQVRVFFHQCGLSGILNFLFLLANKVFPKDLWRTPFQTFPARRKFLLSLRRWLAVLEQARLRLECLKTVPKHCGFVSVFILALNLHI